METLKKVIDTVGGEITRMSPRDVFGYEGGTWKEYYNSLNRCSLDRIDFNYEDINKQVFVIEDGGEMINLNDGRWMIVCWRGDACRVFEEEDEDKCGRLSLIAKGADIDILYE